MNTPENREGRSTKRIRRMARIWSVPIILYALIMLIGYAWNWVTIGTADPYAVEDVSFIEALPPILLFISALGLALAWRWEKLGSVIALVLQGATLVLLIIQSPLTDSFWRSAIPFFLVLVAAVPGILFLVSWLRSKGATSPSLALS